MNHASGSTPTSADKMKFVIMSIVGAFFFLIPFPIARGEAPNIALGHAINWFGALVNSVEVNGFGLIFLITVIVLTASALITLLAYTVKPAFIMESKKMSSVFHCGVIYLIARLFAAFLAWGVFLSLHDSIPALGFMLGWTGATLMLLELIVSNGGLMTIFFFLAFLMPILTDFGFLEFIGVLIKKAMRALFTLPGRSSINVITSWFGSSAAGVIIARDQYEKGFYTRREAAAIAANFCVVSLPFTFAVVGVLELLPYFPVFYLIVTIVGIILAIALPRIWPLINISDEYHAEVGKQVAEEVDPGTSLFAYAVDSAALRARETKPEEVVKSGLGNWLDIYMDLIPIILVLGTIAVMVSEWTVFGGYSIFHWIGWPFGQLLAVLGVPDAMAFAGATVVGFVDMFIPALMLGGDAPIQTRFVIGAVSIIQIIYMAETGVLMLKAKLLTFWQLCVIFLMRTIIAIPIVVVLTNLLFNP